jgi:hypothetical protein
MAIGVGKLPRKCNNTHNTENNVAKIGEGPNSQRWAWPTHTGVTAPSTFDWDRMLHVMWTWWRQKGLLVHRCVALSCTERQLRNRSTPSAFKLLQPCLPNYVTMPLALKADALAHHERKCRLVACFPAMVGKAAGPLMSAPPPAASCEHEPVTKPGPSGASASGALLPACRTERSPKRVLQLACK